MDNKVLIDEISLKIQEMVKNQLKELSILDIERTTFTEFELLLRQKVQEIGRELLEQSIPLLYGNGYKGSSFENNFGENCSCVLKSNKREFLSTFGKVTYYRAYYQNDSDGSSFGPLDYQLDLQNKSKISPALRYYSGLLSVNTSFQESSDILSKIININLSSSKNADLLEEKGKLRDEVYRDKIKDISHDSDGRISIANIKHNKTNPKRIVYLEADGCHIPILDDWNECKTFVLFETEKFKDKNTGKEKTQIVNKKYYSTMNKIIAFKKQLKIAVEEYCGDDEVQIVCIGDGAHWIWKMCNQLFLDNAIEILDWYHIDEKICEFSSKIYEENETEKEYFQNEMKELIYKGDIDKALEYLNEIHDTIPKQTIPCLYNIIGYIENNKTKMNYANYKEKMGLIIGSGTIESANKYVIQRRMKLSGMRWKFNNANAIAQLRADYINEDFEKLYGIRDNFQFAYNQESEIKFVN